jgi:hypothetical protein
MNYLQCVGAPFDPINHHSSNSNTKPKTFSWTVTDQPNKVFIDNHILLNHKKKEGERKYGWVCESRTIVFNVSHILREHHQEIFDQLGYDYIFVSDKSLLPLNSKFKYCLAGSNMPWTPQQEWNIHPKTKLVSMIASNKGGKPDDNSGHRFRHAVAQKYMNRLDLYGGAWGSKPIGKSPNLTAKWHSKEEGLRDYMFSIVTENDQYETYYTEKLTDCFANGTIPIYWGPPSIGDTFNPDGIIVYDDNFNIDMLTPELYQSKLQAIEDNFNRLHSLEGADDMLYRLIKEMV